MSVIAPNKHWEKFLAKFDEIDGLEVKDWKETHALAYICRRFKQLYGRDFSFSFRGAPSKCGELYAIKQIIAALSTANMTRVKQYIDWVYDSVIIPRKMKIRSLFIFSSPGMANQFFEYIEKQEKIDRTTELPEIYKQIVSSLNLPVSTYGDLAFAKMALDQAPESPSRAPYKVLFEKLVAAGFSVENLNNL